MNPLFTTITEEEFGKNFDFIISLVQRGNGFYIKTNDEKLVALIPINDPIAQSLIKNESVESDIQEAMKDFVES